MNEFQEGVRRHLLTKWTPLSVRIEQATTSTPFPGTALVSAVEHARHTRHWVASLRGMEAGLMQDAAERYDTVPVVAPMMVMEAMSGFMQQTMGFLGSASRVFKAYVQMFGNDEERLRTFADNLHGLTQAVADVAMDSLLAALSQRPDKKTGLDKPALDAWSERHELFKKAWGEVIAGTPDPEKVSEYAIMFQARLMKLAQEIKPELRDLPKPNDDDFVKFSAQTGIPIERLKELLNRPVETADAQPESGSPSVAGDPPATSAPGAEPSAQTQPESPAV